MVVQMTCMTGGYPGLALDEICWNICIRNHSLPKGFVLDNVFAFLSIYSAFFPRSLLITADCFGNV